MCFIQMLTGLIPAVLFQNYWPEFNVYLWQINYNLLIFDYLIFVLLCCIGGYPNYYEFILDKLMQFLSHFSGLCVFIIKSLFISYVGYNGL